MIELPRYTKKKKLGWLEQSAHLWNRGMNTSEIAAVVGLSESSIWDRMDTIRRVALEMRAWPQRRYEA